ncbi:MAG: hypothetical protein WKG07_32465 [Hymenobacter sp.]
MRHSAWKRDCPQGFWGTPARWARKSRSSAAGRAPASRGRGCQRGSPHRAGLHRWLRSAPRPPPASPMPSSGSRLRRLGMKLTVASRNEATMPLISSVFMASPVYTSRNSGMVSVLEVVEAADGGQRQQRQKNGERSH